MTANFRVFLAAAIGLIAGVVLSNALAQSSSLARALDPPNVAPHIFEVLLDTERVRAMKVTERFGETQPLHHRGDRVVVHLTPCAWVIEEDDGSSRMESYQFGDVYWRDAVTLGGQTSNVIDACISVEIELKEDVSAN